jgi:hypothetical protein
MEQLDVVYLQEQPDDGVKLGCIMLAKVRSQASNPSARVPMRCSLGYALRTEGDVFNCLAVAGPGDCWRKEPNWRVLATDVISESEEVEQQPEAVVTSFDVPLASD